MSNWVGRAIEVYSESGLTTLLRSVYDATVRWRIHTGVQWLRYRRSLSEPYRLLYIDPSVVKKMVRPSFQKDRSRFGTCVIGGDWDLRKWETNSEIFFRDLSPNEEKKLFPISQYETYRSFVAHFGRGVPWEETDFYNTHVEWIENGHQTSRGHRSESEFRERCDQLDELYDELRQSRYKTQRELGDPINLSTPEADEVAVNITRDGEFVLDEGRHRLFIARLLDLDTIPVRVKTRHIQWQKYRHRVYYSDGSPASFLPEGVSVDHPDLEDVL